MQKRLFLAGLVLTSIATMARAELPAELEGLGLWEHDVASRELPGWKKPDKVLVSTMFGPQFIAPLKVAAPSVEIVAAATIEEAVEAAPGVQAVIGICDQEVLAAAGTAHWVQTFFAGVEDCVSLPAVQDGILLSNGQRLSSPTIADHAIALSYALVRNTDIFLSNQADANWDRSAASSLFSFGELSGRTMLVVGLGGIGTQVAQRAHALGMKVVATRGSRREGPEYVDYVGLAHEAIELAKQADIVVNAAPLTDATRGMFNAAFFEAMKPSAYFISVGRGQSTNTDDLMAALQTGAIAGAGLDVTDPEPLPADHPLWASPRVIITPHVAALSQETIVRIQRLVAENLRRYVAGDPLLSVVDIKRGY